MSLAAQPLSLTGNPDGPEADTLAGQDVLSDVLRSIRLTGAVQFCFMPTGEWETDASPSIAALGGAASAAVPFHVVVEGACWLWMEGRRHELIRGDVVAFPLGTGHQLGVGSGGRVVHPTRDLPPRPWRGVPVLRYGDAPGDVRLFCGYLTCAGIRFGPLRDALPGLMHARTAEAPDTEWLRATIRQIAAEVDRPRAGSIALLERLTEVAFIELLRQQIAAAAARRSTGWLAALGDPALGRCLARLHAEPERDWAVADLAAAAGLSRSALMERCGAVLGMSPIRYLRRWRLHLASEALSLTAEPIAAIAHGAGYGSEAAFSRAFARAYGLPPASWRQQTRPAA